MTNKKLDEPANWYLGVRLTSPLWPQWQDASWLQKKTESAITEKQTQQIQELSCFHVVAFRYV